MTFTAYDEIELRLDYLRHAREERGEVARPTEVAAISNLIEQWDESFLRQLAQVLRANGATWQWIAERFAITEQAAQQRFEVAN